MGIYDQTHVSWPSHMKAQPTCTVSCCHSEVPFAAASGFHEVFLVPKANCSHSLWERCALNYIDFKGNGMHSGGNGLLNFR